MKSGWGKWAIALIFLSCSSVEESVEYLDRIEAGTYAEPGDEGPPSKVQDKLVFGPDGQVERHRFYYDPDTLSNGNIVYERPVLLSILAGTLTINSDSLECYWTKMGSVYDENRLTSEMINDTRRRLEVSPNPMGDIYLFRKVTKGSFEAVLYNEDPREWEVWTKE